MRYSFSDTRPIILCTLFNAFFMIDFAGAQIVGIRDIGLQSGFQDTSFGHHKRGRAGIGADFDLDGYIDYFRGNPGDESFILRNVATPGGRRRFMTHQVLVTDSLAWGGVSFDYDNDGDYDLFVTCGANEGVGYDYLFRNDWILNGTVTGVLNFTDVTYYAGVAGPRPPREQIPNLRVKFTASTFDCGLPAGSHPGIMMRGGGGPSNPESEGPVRTASAGAVVSDYDRDGDEDIFVSTNMMNTPYPELTGRNTLWKNNGDGTFTDATYEAGLGTILGPTRHSTFFDYDNDGDRDIYENNFGAENYLWQNNGDGTFTDVTTEASASGHDLHYPWWSFVSASADLNNDGWEDLVVFMRGYDDSTYGSPYEDGHAIYINNGGVFENIAPSTIVNDNYVPILGVMGCMVGDVSGDGLPDIYLGHGGPNGGRADQFYVSVPGALSPTFVNNTSLIDFPASIPSGLPVPPYPYRTHGTTFVDIDNDGYLEIAVVNGGPSYMADEVREPNRLFKVQTASGYNWLKVRPVGNGTTVPLDGIGTRIALEVSKDGGPSWQIFRTLFASSAFSAQNGFVLHFGLADADTILRMVVKWPDGSSNIVTEGLSLNSSLVVKMTTDQTVLLKPGDGTPGGQKPPSFRLDQNQPNPFNPSTTIGYAVDTDGRVNISVFDLLGRKVSTLVNEFQTAGYRSIVWDAKSDEGQRVASGVYFYRMQVDNHVVVQKMLLTH